MKDEKLKRIDAENYMKRTKKLCFNSFECCLLHFPAQVICLHWSTHKILFLAEFMFLIYCKTFSNNFSFQYFFMKHNLFSLHTAPVRFFMKIFQYTASYINNFNTFFLFLNPSIFQQLQLQQNDRKNNRICESQCSFYLTILKT